MDSLEVKAFNFNHECLSECLHVGSPQNVDKLQKRDLELRQKGKFFNFHLSFSICKKEVDKETCFWFLLVLAPEMMERLLTVSSRHHCQCGVSLWLDVGATIWLGCSKRLAFRLR